MISMYQPSILALLETRMSNYKNLVEELGFPCQIQSSASGTLGYCYPAER